jgi:hypothetical protein
MTGEQRYLYDPQFKTLVDFMVNTIIERKYTPSEMRDAAMLASIKYEMTHAQTWMQRSFPEEFKP